MPGRVAKQASYKGGFPRMNEDVRVAAVSVEWGLEVCATRGNNDFVSDFNWQTDETADPNNAEACRGNRVHSIV